MSRKYRVLISSTTVDLAEERTHLREIRTQMQAADLDFMEDWGARPGTPAQESAMAAGDAIYVGIFGDRYGSRDPVTNLSYTELEYRSAVSNGRPCLIFLKKSVAPPAAASLEDAADLERLTAELRRAHPVSEYDDPRRLCTQIVLAVQNLIWRLEQSNTAKSDDFSVLILAVVPVEKLAALCRSIGIPFPQASTPDPGPAVRGLVRNILPYSQKRQELLDRLQQEFPGYDWDRFAPVSKIRQKYLTRAAISIAAAVIFCVVAFWLAQKYYQYRDANRAVGQWLDYFELGKPDLESRWQKPAWPLEPEEQGSQNGYLVANEPGIATASQKIKLYDNFRTHFKVHFPRSGTAAWAYRAQPRSLTGAPTQVEGYIFRLANVGNTLQLSGSLRVGGQETPLRSGTGQMVTVFSGCCDAADEEAGLIVDGAAYGDSFRFRVNRQKDDPTDSEIVAFTDPNHKFAAGLPALIQEAPGVVKYALWCIAAESKMPQRLYRSGMFLHLFDAGRFAESYPDCPGGSLEKP